MKPDFDNPVFNETPDAIIVATPDGTVAYWNRHAEAAFGYATVEAIRRLVSEMIVPPDRFEIERKILQQTIQNGSATSATHTIIERPIDSSTQADTKSQAANATQKELDVLVHQYKRRKKK